MDGLLGPEKSGKHFGGGGLNDPGRMGGNDHIFFSFFFIIIF